MPISEVIPESVSRLERKRARNRDALVAAARRLFARDGAEATTIAAIAEAADLGFGTFYRYFPDKDSILEAVLDAGEIEINAVLTDTQSGEASAEAELRSLTARLTGAMRRNRDVITLVWQVGVRGETPDARRIRPDQLPPERSLPIQLATAVQRIIERGIASGEFAPLDVALVSRFISSAHMYLLHPSAMNVDEQQLIEALCDFELRALMAGAGASVQKIAPREASPRKVGRKTE